MASAVLPRASADRPPIATTHPTPSADSSVLASEDVLLTPDPARMPALARMADRVAHDLNNLVASLQAYGELARESIPANTPAAEDVEGVLGTVAKLATFSRELTAIGRAPEAPADPLLSEPVPVRTLVDELRPTLEAVLGAERPLLIVGADPAPPISSGGADVLATVLGILLINAREAAPAGFPVQVTVGAVPGHPDASEVAVADQGPGIPPQVRERLFEPMATTKGGLGRGLGLTRAWRLMTRAGGTIHIGRGPGGVGTRVALRFPAVPRP